MRRRSPRPPAGFWLLALPSFVLLLGLWLLAAAATPPCTATVHDDYAEPIRLAAAVAAAPALAAPRTIAPSPLRSLVANPGERRRERVRVHGQVRRAGQPVHRCELSFFAAGEEWRENAIDWDITDRDGRYEVELPAATLAVACDAPWRIWRSLLVPSGSPDVRLDIELP